MRGGWFLVCGDGSFYNPRRKGGGLAYPQDSIEGRFLRGEPEAVGEVSRWVARMVALPRFWALRNQWEDMHQEILGRVTESLRSGRFDRSRDFRAYVQGVARFTAMDAMGRAGRLGGPSAAAVDPDELQGRGGDLERAVAARQLARLILDAATDECRTVIRAYYFQGKAYREIAREQGIPVGTVKSRLFRCLSTAHDLLRRPGAGPGNLSAEDGNS